LCVCVSVCVQMIHTHTDLRCVTFWMHLRCSSTAPGASSGSTKRLHMTAQASICNACSTASIANVRVSASARSVFPSLHLTPQCVCVCACVYACMHVHIHAHTNVWVLQVAEGERRGLCAIYVCNIGTDDQRRHPFCSDSLQQSRLCSREEPLVRADRSWTEQNKRSPGQLKPGRRRALPRPPFGARLSCLQ